MNLTIKNGDLLTDHGFERRDLHVVDGVITAASAGDAEVIDATGLVVAPGIIDLHGDGFERSLSPRPGVYFDMETALIDTDRQLLANGVTTAYLALTISWEPGLRSLSHARELITAWRRLRPGFATDMRIQLRWEIAALDAVETIEEWLHLEPAPTLAFNDHFSLLLDPSRDNESDAAKHASRAGLTIADYNDLTRRTAAIFDQSPAAIARLATAAADAGVVCFAHDEKTVEVRRQNRALGIRVSEFPLTREAAAEAVSHDELTVLGAPNVVRGGSHIGAVNAEPAAVAGLCGALASDYYYPAPLQAAARLLARSDMMAGDVWKLVSGNAARAVGLTDRGELVTGKRADLAIFALKDGKAAMKATIAGGRPVFNVL